MPKPKPPSPAEAARQKAENDLPQLQQQLLKLLDGEMTYQQNQQSDKGKNDLEKGKEKGNKTLHGNEGDGMDDGNTDDGETDDGETDDGETDDGETDGEVTDEEDEELLDSQDTRHAPDKWQVEVQGVCVVTEKVIKESLATYNGDAIDWIKLHIGGESMSIESASL